MPSIGMEGSFLFLGVELKNIGIFKKVMFAFLTLVLTFAGASTIVFVNQNAVRQAEARNELSTDLTLLSKDMFTLMLQQLNNVRAFVTTGDEGFAKKYEAFKAKFEEDISEFSSQTSLPSQKKLAQEMAAAAKAWQTSQAEPEMDRVRRLVAEGQFTPQGGDLRLPEVKRFHDEMLDAQRQLMDERRDQQAYALTESKTALIAGGIIATLMAIGMAFLLNRLIAEPVRNMTEVMRRLAGGDHSIDVPAVGQKDEIGQMAQAVLTFRQAAIEKEQVEADAAKQRKAADAERERAEAIQAETAEEQKLVVAEVGAGLSALSDGNLTYRIEAAFPGDYKKLRDDFNRAIEKLQNAMKTITRATDGISSGTSEISQASDDLSKRTEQQAASLEETAAALDQITATVRKTAEGAVHAGELVTTAKDGAERSGKVVKDAVNAMSAIEASSNQISQIIGVIDEIAFQTNLLALNAGVEAARAGDAGKGFAVVAQEVRALAQRSAEAAKEIKTLIQTSSSQVGQGVNLVDQAGEALTRIVEQVTEINAIVQDISNSAQEQATGLAQVNTAVNQMDQVTQQNAAMVEELTAAAHSLSGETDELARLVAEFEVGRVEKAPSAEVVRVATRAKPVVSKPSAPKAVAAVAGNTALKIETEPQAGASEEGWEEF